MSVLTKQPLRLIYEKSASDYAESLPLEHYMEATPQSTQRRITLASLELVEAERSDFHLFNELLVQYPLPKNKIGKVVPDNMVVLHDGPIDAVGSYDLPFQPAKPFWTLEYVSKKNRRKDYKDNRIKYERDLKVPYYLLFEPEKQKLILFRRRNSRFVSTRRNKDGRLPIPKLDLEVGLLDGWVRFWYQGKLLPLPKELLNELRNLKRKLTVAKRKLTAANQQLDAANQRADAAEKEAARLRAELKRLGRGRNGR